MRLGIGIEDWPTTDGKRRVWIQAVSLGEILVVEALLRSLAEDDGIEILLTTTTSTGYRLATEKYSDICDKISYFPLDFWPFSRKFWKRMRPDLAICAETELWPEHMQQARNAGIPLLLVNARLSDRSYKYALPLRWMYRKHLGAIRKTLAISDEDAERFRMIGVPADRIEVMGNLKVDVSIGKLLSPEEKSDMKASLGLGDGFVLLGSSTWPGEEAALLAIFKELRGKLDQCRLLIVPRHAERREEIRSLLEQETGELTYGFKSEGVSSDLRDILVADTSGELRLLTQLSDLAFVGKSLSPHTEGQTPIECGLLGVPVVFGPGMANFRSVRSGMREQRAARQVRDVASLRAALIGLALDDSARAEMTRNQGVWATRSRGSLLRATEAILEELAQR